MKMVKQVKISLNEEDEIRFNEMKEYLGVGADAEVFRAILKISHDRLKIEGTLFTNNLALSKLTKRIDKLESILSNPSTHPISDMVSIKEQLGEFEMQISDINQQIQKLNQLFLDALSQNIKKTT